jgi:hypothetical protein
LEADRVFFLKQVRVKAASGTRADLVDADVVMSALLFLKGPEDIAPPRGKGKEFKGPLGH